MEEQQNYNKKPKYSDNLKRYPLGEGNWLMGIQTSKRFHCWGEIAGKHIDLKGENLQEVEKELYNVLEKLKIDYLNKASKSEEIALRIKENGLEKTSKYLGGKK
ncbi:MAG: hypothetical protein BWY36_00209 [Candidatus Diapherotrites archaeon ADurb.Bin253]|jgi:hypothetical protein|nr:MAG: hypothetical protein BWY36_00209 [Candidatus Diapherotrites archaeon ADurb.Bin253]HNZ52502.1 hypothetical protein [Candidatus Pacearchaeota archaeon]HOF43841.1 hypothetical protein [Candidatus Pacearchaeota archaeon]HOH03842.1 hypothetical protein [Candidatus Pacearchaeota archaeon]HOR52535.1 hypothetical protein [Candidatus Pacearchaeota archaeon]